MTYKLSRPGHHEYSATSGNLRDLQAKIACWFVPAQRLTYRMEDGEGWVYVNGEQFGYISATQEGGR